VPVDVDDCESQMGVVISCSMDTASTAHDQLEKNIHQKDAGKSRHFSERLMIWYARQLMKPRVTILIILVFASYTAFCSYRMTLLTQEFNVEDYTVRSKSKSWKAHILYMFPNKILFQSSFLSLPTHF
jgi:hypothetical protein